MGKALGLFLCVTLAATGGAYSAESSENLRAGFAHPPDSARPWVYWFWLNGNITREGITADLEAMERVGIGGVLIMEVDQGTPVGPVDFMSDRWRELFQHVVAEAERLGLEVNMNDDAGWNGSGGPWIKPEQSMQKVVWTETEVEGPKRFEGTLPQPEAVASYYRDISVLAFPTPGPYRIDNIEQKACYRVGFIYPGIPPEIPRENTIERSQIADLSAQMDNEGRLVWEVPAGKWTVMRFGHTSTGATNEPSPATGRGLECDKLSKEGIEANFAGMMGKLIDDVGPRAGKTLAATHVDSWENGAQNWTARMREEFKARRGYDLLPFLPTFSGRVVDSLEISERFLWDLRQTVSDLVVENYAGHLQTLARQHGLRLSIEAYGGPCDDLPYAARADEPMSEFWVGGNALSVCKEMASAVHTYGKTILGAEAFTADDSERWLQHPATLKSLGDRAFCLGVNRFVFHRYAMQPWRDRRPGMTMGPWGVHYERTQTWWDWTPAWHAYLARCHFILRQGLFVADICYLQPEAAPQGFHEHNRNGYDYDNCSAEVVLTRMTAKNGRVVLPDGMSYGLLVLPNVPTMTPALLHRIRELVQAGATVIGPRPQKSPSLTDYPACDDEVKRIADEVWGDCDGNTIKEHKFGEGRVLWGVEPEEALQKAGFPPDFTSGGARLDFIHRKVGADDVYFVANPRSQSVTAACSFRVRNRTPEFWGPDTGRIVPAAMFAERDRVSDIVLDLGPSGSVFVVFRDQPRPLNSVLKISQDGQPILSVVDTAPKILVTKAQYGVLSDPQRTRDVRYKLQKKVDAGEYHISVARLAEGDDPALNLPKSVVIEYTAGDKTFIVSGDDRDTVHLTADSTKIVVEKATYGVLSDPQRTRDVREKAQHILDTGEMSFQVARMAEGDDPAVGIVKTLILEYSTDGRRMTATGTDAERMTLYEPAASTCPVKIHSDHQFQYTMEVSQNGRYEVAMPNARNLTRDVQNLPTPLEVGGPWEVLFDSKWGTPERITMERLVSWSEHSDAGVRYYSGPATYMTVFKVPEELFGESRRLYLDLGTVQVMAKVSLNGKDFWSLWKPPFRMDVTDTLKAGENQLKVSVVNLWVNRLIGDEQLPDDSLRHDNGTLKEWPQWVAEEQPSPAGRFTFTTWRLWKKDAPLQPSGLIGPVTLQATEVVELSSD
ncbi:MAG: hypothetical protein HY706_16830 [Candidatus Hydrogenedentes bacterium]|nr:hypothetical protein [Candidatus Hydrogenedentota bacterium]